MRTSTNSHILIYGTSGSEKTSFLKHYLDQTKTDFSVFGRDEKEFNDKFKVEDLFRFGRHLNIQVIYLAHYANEVVRENCFKLYITINNPDSFLETIVTTYNISKEHCLKDHWKQYRSQLEYGVIEFDTRSQKYKILNQKYQVVYDTTKHK